METAVIVKVAVSAAPYSIDKPYDYWVPSHLEQAAVPGVRVTIPFGRGNRSTEGIVLARDTGEKTRYLKPVSAVLDTSPVLDRDEIALALWMRQRYFCTLFEAAKTILPAGLWYSLREVWRLKDPELDRLTADGRAAGIPLPGPLPPFLGRNIYDKRRLSGKKKRLCRGKNQKVDADLPDDAAGRPLSPHQQLHPDVRPGHRL